MCDTREQQARALLREYMTSALTIYLQPLYSLESGRVYGAEVLARIIAPGGHVQPPLDFLDNMERTRMIAQVDLEVLRQACRLFSAGKQAWPGLRLSCNLSRLTLMEPELLPSLDGILADTGADPAQLILEITERSHGIELKELEMQLEALRARGITLALDDLGTEASCLNMLHFTQLGVAKLDRSLVSHMADSDRARTLLSGLVELCHRLGLKCVAEGVETREQLELLSEMHCDGVQGFFIGRPMPVKRFFAQFAPLY